MSYCICFGSGSDITTFDIADDDQTFFFTIIHGLFKCHHTGNAELLIHCYLRLHSGYQIINCIHNTLVILPDCFCGTFQGLTILSESRLFNIFRHEFHHRIQSYHDRCVGFFDSSDQFVDHISSVLQ